MEALIVLGLTFGLLWLLFLLPQQRRVRAHQQLVASLEEGDDVILSAGIYGRISSLGPEDLDLEVAPGVELRVARQAVLRRIEHAAAVDEPDDLQGPERLEGPDRLERPEDEEDDMATGAERSHQTPSPDEDA
jgi:preprotein translocase subunit YajC